MAAVAFVAYAYLANGSITGFVEAHKTFPGAQSPVVSSGRHAAQEEISKFSGYIARLPGLQPIYVSTQRMVDSCVKGRHDSIISIENTNSGFAYSCDIDSLYFLAFKESPCDVASALGLRHIYYNALGDSCDSADSETGSIKPPGASIVTVSKASDYLRGNGDYDPNLLQCRYIEATVYCEEHEVTSAQVKNALAGIPQETQTIVEVDINALTYFNN